MKESKNIKFTNATITLEDGVYKITEFTKDAEKTYNLSERLEEFIDVDGISLQITKTEDIAPDEE